MWSVFCLGVSTLDVWRCVQYIMARFYFLFIHVPLPVAWRMWPASVKAVGGSTEMSLVGYPLLVFFFFSCIYLPLLLCFQTHSGAYYSNCSLVLPAGPSILQVMLSVLLLFCRLCCFPEIAAFLFFFFLCVCVWINGSLAHSISWLYLVAAIQSNVQLLHVGSSIHYLHFRVEYYTPFRSGAMLWKLCKYSHQNLSLCVFRLCFAVRQRRLLVQACTWGCCDCAENKKSNEKQIEVKQCVSC